MVIITSGEEGGKSGRLSPPSCELKGAQPPYVDTLEVRDYITNLNMIRKYEIFLIPMESF